jgi:hypothetical protein
MVQKSKTSSYSRKIVFLSLLLLFFTVPHTLEDFSTGEPGKAGIPAPLLALVVSTVLSVQALGLYWLGQERRIALWVHLGVGAFWPLASGLAQLPSILSGIPYRAGFISIMYVLGILIIGLLLFFNSLIALRSK